MTEPVSNSSGPNAADDLFDLPVEALNLPGMDAVDTAAALAAFKIAEPEIAALAEEALPAGEEELPEAAPPDEVIETSPPSPLFELVPRSRIVWIGAGALVLGSVLALLPRAFKSHPPAPQIAGIPPATAPEIGTHPTPKPEPARPVPVPRHPDEPDVSRQVSVARHSDEPDVAHEASATRPAPNPRPTRDVPLPPPSLSGQARLQAVQNSLEAGHRAFARVQLGRILLDIDTLPADEREETRAQAELLVARTLQDAADEARRSSR